ncbi:MAG TPA: universal stress protein [Stellaceae bacterium]|jgi:nucleotide-binding universal stress UspA family protein|nr:universal stress protein [Stellaceae bacterium]
MSSIKTILAAVSGGTASGGAAELACRLARRFEAHIEGFHAKPDPLDLFRFDASVGEGITGDFIDKFTDDTNAAAAKVRAEFVAALERHGMTLAPHVAGALLGKIGASASWREAMGDGPALVARRARFFDLAVLGRSERAIDQIHSDAVEETLTRSGRPVLLAPAKAPETIGERVLLGWNGSAEAVRALTGAQPFLSTARETFVVSIGDQHHDSAHAAVEYLAWHDVKARHIGMPSHAGLSVGQRLLRAAVEQGGDLLVMGAYGHMPWREFLFGGATREVIGTGVVPVLLSH